MKKITIDLMSVIKIPVLIVCFYKTLDTPAFWVILTIVLKDFACNFTFRKEN